MNTQTHDSTRSPPTHRAVAESTQRGQHPVDSPGPDVRPLNLTQTFELVQRAQGGERSALDRLFARYYDRVRAIVRVRMGAHVRSLCDSGDILQETFAVAVRNFDRFEMQHEGALVNWLAKLAQRQITDAVDRADADKRDRRRERPIDAAQPDGPRLELVSAAPGPAELLASDEDRLLVEHCLAELAPEHSELILLRNYADMSWREIAEETGRPSADAARMAHTTALLALTKQVKARRETSPG